jgi:hypothetical protein
VATWRGILSGQTRNGSRISMVIVGAVEVDLIFLLGSKVFSQDSLFSPAPPCSAVDFKLGGKYYDMDWGAN